MSSAEPEKPTPDEVRWIADRYRLDGLVGRGAMGTVWAAYDNTLGRKVAVKEVRLPPGIPVAEADALRERTLREARAIAALSHPNVVTLYDVVRQADEPFVVMELVPSMSLAELVKEQGPLSTPQAATIADAVASALSAAHHAGITHRDVKPGNVLVGTDGQIKLTDFGIARSLSDHTLTHSGLMLGTPAFIAPEVASGDPATPAADLWGLGATLYAALTGQAPYDVNGDPLETVTEVVRGDVPHIAPDHPLYPVVTGLMVKEPTERLALHEVRLLIHSLLPKPGSKIFDVTPKTLTPVTETALAETVPPAVADQSAPALLAADPGPLPFLATSPITSRRRSRLATFSIGLMAFILFVTGTGGGFALARMLGGHSIVPQAEPDLPPVPLAPVGNLVPRTDRATVNPNSPGGEFTVKVPQSWQSFREQRVKSPAPSMAVHFVSSDGRQELVIERFADYYPQFRIDAYVKSLRINAASSRGQFELKSNQADGTINATTSEQPRRLLYRIADLGPSSGLERRTPAPTHSAGDKMVRRTSYVYLLPHNRDLWVLQVDVPTELEDKGQTELFTPILASFAPRN